MKSTITAHAPGKAIISGEYAVLRGAAAISVALDCRATVTLAPSQSAEFTVCMPGLAEGEFAFTLSPDGVCVWQGEPPAGGRALVEAALSACQLTQLPFVAIEIDTRPFFDQKTGRKLGLGSSAAAMTALVSALCTLGGITPPGMRVAAEAHIAFQGGYGSGVDVATSYHGGVIAFKKHQFDVQRRQWPAGLSASVLWSGKPADTASRLASLSGADSDAGGWASLQQAADRAAAAWEATDVPGILQSLRRYSDALQSFSDARQLQVFHAGHLELARLAESMSVVYKPCGAGGGDIGMVFASDNAAMGDFRAEARRCGFRDLPFVRDDNGVVVNSGEGRD